CARSYDYAMDYW
nr:immunoglobulin heavy chain junction region [Mus musculus]MBK4198448.1 immunoglobulin heavy chain junction region [Mus musculus]MBK4198449.1 immunoglobulin heavy chain junction region [Mus musculus]MBK4198450.1 immunoglobulin heavy chain junction region [Mus musculus]MBK4198451.1 immunoglobulin heavy chain junction region [Mus musculus]